MRRNIIAAFVLLSLCGCDRDDAAASADGNQSAVVANAAADPTTVAPVDAAATATAVGRDDAGEGMQNYTCDNGMSLAVTYGDDSVGLLINGVEYDLPGVPAASGGKYKADAGLTPGMSLAWWTKGNEAMLIEAPIGERTGEHELIVKCREKG